MHFSAIIAFTNVTHWPSSLGNKILDNLATLPICVFVSLTRLVVWVIEKRDRVACRHIFSVTDRLLIVSASKTINFSLVHSKSSFLLDRKPMPHSKRLSVLDKVKFRRRMKCLLVIRKYKKAREYCYMGFEKLLFQCIKRKRGLFASSVEHHIKASVGFNDFHPIRCAVQLASRQNIVSFNLLELFKQPQ